MEQMRPEEKQKACSKCHTARPFSKFYNSKHTGDGKISQCKDCFKAHYTSPENRAKKLAYMREYVSRPTTLKRVYERNQRPEVKANRAAYQLVRGRQLRKDPEYRRIEKENRKRRLEDPVVREKFNSRNRAYLKARRSDPVLGARGREWARSDYKTKHELYLWRTAKSRAEKNKLIFSVPCEAIKIPKICPVLGLEIRKGDRHVMDCSPSIDRVIPELGYIPGNVAVISQRANRIKNCGTIEEHLAVANWIEKQSRIHLLDRPSLDPGPEEIRKRMLWAARHRAKIKDLDFDICLEDVSIPEKCPILGIPIVCGTNKRHDNSPALDRIDSSRGYTVGNCAVLSWKANCLKNNGTAEEHRKIALWMQAFIKSGRRAA